MTGNTERSTNMVPSVVAKSNAADNADVVVWADPSTHRLLVNASVSISGGSLTNNNAAPGATNIGALVAVANASAPTWTEGNQVLLSTDLSGNLRVTGSLSVGGTADNATFTAGTTTGTAAFGFFHSTIDTVTDGHAAAVAIDSKRSQFMVIRDAGLNARGANVDANNNLGVVLAAETSKVIGTINLSAAQTLATVTTVSTVTAVTTVTNLAQMNGAALLMGNGVTGTGSQRVTLASDNSAVALWGHGATAASVPANITYQGKRGTTALPTAVTDGQSVGAMSDKYGRAVVIPGTIRDLVGTQTTTISASTSETTIVTAAASIFNDLIMLVVSNTSATATRLDFRDTTGGSVLFSLYVPAGDTRGFNMGGIPVPQTSVNTNWTAQSSASVTDLRVYAVFAKNK